MRFHGESMVDAWLYFRFDDAFIVFHGAVMYFHGFPVESLCMVVYALPWGAFIQLSWCIHDDGVCTRCIRFHDAFMELPWCFR